MRQDSSSVVLPKLPRAGLGNMLYVWAKAIVFADINNLSVVAPNWTQLRIGPYFRREKYKRLYGGYFSSHEYVPQIVYQLKKLNPGRVLYSNPNIFAKVSSDELEGLSDRKATYVFDEVPLSVNFLSELREFQPLIKSQLISMMTPRIREAVENTPTPEIGIHVRLSDFRDSEELTSPSRSQSVSYPSNIETIHNIRTPLDWYMQSLLKIRRIAGYDVPATVFSDGYDKELKELISLPNVIRSPDAPAIVDLFTMSKSKCLIASAKSSFSAWASYLGQCPTLWHPTQPPTHYFPEPVNQQIFEGHLDPFSSIESFPELLRANIESVFTSDNVVVKSS